MKTAGIILAAGRSQRMGSEKAMLAFGDTTFLAAAIASLRPLAEAVFVVCGENLAALRPEIEKHGAVAVLNPSPQDGQLSSLQCGLRAAIGSGFERFFITHVDRPPAQAETLCMLAGVIREDIWAVVPQFNGIHGHPIVAMKAMAEAWLAAPAANSTANEVEHAHQPHILYLDVDDAAVIPNVNTPADYQSLTGREIKRDVK